MDVDVELEVWLYFLKLVYSVKQRWKVRLSAEELRSSSCMKRM